MEIYLQAGLLCFGFFLLIKGADRFVEGTSQIAKRCNISQLVIGLTVVAMGTSAPEAAVSISSALKGNADITIGNILGSNILNILVILGSSALITSLPVARSTIRYEMPFLLGITILLFIQGLDGSIGLMDGIVQLGCFVVYIGYLLMLARRQKEKMEEIISCRPLWQLLMLTAVGLVFIIWGSDLSVDAAVAIANDIGVSERFIGLTIVAFGTSLPELCTSLIAARKGNADIAIGNIVGSNIFNILFVVGLSALIVPVPFASSFILDVVVAAVSTLFLLLFCWKRRKLNRGCGWIMLFGYICYFMMLW